MRLVHRGNESVLALLAGIRARQNALASCTWLVFVFCDDQLESLPIRSCRSNLVVVLNASNIRIDKVASDEAMIKDYIKNQEKHERDEERGLFDLN